MIIVSALLLTAGISHSSSTDSTQANFALLKSLRSPREQLQPCLPPHYRVPVTIGGSVAAEMLATVRKLGLSAPRYREEYEGRGRFRLTLANEDYPRETGELLCGILNPIDMTEAVLGSIIKYRDDQTLRRMLQQTVISRSEVTIENRRMLQLDIRPSAERFNYFYEDRGPQVVEEWLSRLQLTIDAAAADVYEISFVKHVRVTGSGEDRAPVTTVRHYRYLIAYTRCGTATLPQRLEVHTDSVLTMRLSAGYRQVAHRILFDRRTICAFNGAAVADSVVMSYGEYDLRTPVAARPQSSGKRDEKLKNAAALASQASQAIASGAVGKASALLQTLCRRYPDTPQAVEARKLLSGLPAGR
jgi:hypothetical protein